MPDLFNYRTNVWGHDAPIYPAPLAYITEATPADVDWAAGAALDVPPGLDWGADLDPVEEVYSIVFSPESTSVLTAGGGIFNTGVNLQLWDIRTERLVWGLAPNIRGDYVYRAHLHPETYAILAAGGHQVALWSWDSITDMQARTENRWVAGRALSPLFEIDLVTELDLVGRTNDRLTWTNAPFVEHDTGRTVAAPLDVQFSPDGHTILIAGSDGSAQWWDLRQHQQLATLQHTPQQPDKYWPLREATFHPDGTHGATASDDGGVYLWHLPTQRLLQRLEAHPDGANTVAWSPNGEWLASGGYDNMVRLWQPGTAVAPLTLPGHHHWVTSLAWSPDGTFLATCGTDGDVRCWHVATGTCEAVYETNRELWSVAWSPNGVYIGCSGVNGSVIVWAVTGA
ncbi:WD40 repeat domain-containing protein [bacterium]|nr:WD40 repeat domain-containing protein [bacterium]